MNAFLNVHIFISVNMTKNDDIILLGQNQSAYYSFFQSYHKIIIMSQKRIHKHQFKKKKCLHEVNKSF